MRIPFTSLMLFCVCLSALDGCSDPGSMLIPGRDAAADVRPDVVTTDVVTDAGADVSVVPDVPVQPDVPVHPDVPVPADVATDVGIDVTPDVAVDVAVPGDVSVPDVQSDAAVAADATTDGE